jgi:hypothetical protein
LDFFSVESILSCAGAAAFGKHIDNKANSAQLTWGFG